LFSLRERPGPEGASMERYRPHAIILIVLAVVILAILLSHGVRVRLFWGASGFVAGLVCGVLLTMEVHHRRKHEAGP
jgi:hypothetical protein